MTIPPMNYRGFLSNRQLRQLHERYEKARSNMPDRVLSETQWSGGFLKSIFSKHGRSLDDDFQPGDYILRLSQDEGQKTFGNFSVQLIQPEGKEDAET